MRPAGPVDFLVLDAAIERYRQRVMAESEAGATAGGGLGGVSGFEAWLASFWDRLGGEPCPAFVDGERVALLDGTLEHRVVLDVSDPAMWQEVAIALQADGRIRAISLPGAAPPVPGFRAVERWEYRFDLRFGPDDAGPVPAGYIVAPWQDAARSEAAALLSAVNAASVDGLFLTWPDRPTVQRCAALLDAFVRGSHGPFSPEASLMAWHDGRLAALTLVSLPSPEEALLFEIAARFRHRGTGMAPYLLDRIKVELRGRGFRHVRFLACGTNAAVRSLFRPEEVLSRRLDTGWIWLRD